MTIVEWWGVHVSHIVFHLIVIWLMADVWASLVCRAAHHNHTWLLDCAIIYCTMLTISSVMGHRS
jgi:multisubunit Na+/H+ antiporter MnhG subunit